MQFFVGNCISGSGSERSDRWRDNSYTSVDNLGPVPAGEVKFNFNWVKVLINCSGNRLSNSIIVHLHKLGILRREKSCETLDLLRSYHSCSH